MASRLEAIERRYRALAAELAQVGFISPGSLVVREAASKAAAAKPTHPDATGRPTSGAEQWPARPTAGSTKQKPSSSEWIANRRRIERIITNMVTLSAAVGEMLLRQAATPTTPRRVQR